MLIKCPVQPGALPLAFDNSGQWRGDGHECHRVHKRQALMGGGGVYIFDVTNTHTYYYSEIGYMHNMHTHLNYRFIRSLTAECARRLTLKEIKSPCGMSHPISPPVKMLLFPLVPVTFSSGYLGLCGAERHQRGNLARRPRVDEASP